MSKKPSPKAAAKPAAKTTAVPVAPTEVLPTAFLREVDEAVQQEKLRAFWLRWRLPIIGGVIAILTALAIQQGWNAWERHQSRTLAAMWHTASASTNPEQKRILLNDLVKNGDNGYLALAVFELAKDTLGEEGVTQEKAMAADSLYAKVYNNRGLPQWLRDIARFNAALALMGHNDTLAKEHLQALAPVGSTIGAAPKNTTAIYAPALEALSLMALNAQDNAEARKLTQQLLAQPNLPPDMKQRAERRLGSLSTLVR